MKSDDEEKKSKAGSSPKFGTALDEQLGGKDGLKTDNVQDDVQDGLKSDEEKKKSKASSSPKLGTALVASVILIILASVVVVGVVAKRRTTIAS